MKNAQGAENHKKFQLKCGSSVDLIFCNITHAGSFRVSSQKV